MGRNSKILDLMGQRQKHKEENKTTQSQTSNKFWCIRFGCLDCEMVYISSNGQVQDSHGWSLQNVKRTFWNLIDGVLLFFSDAGDAKFQQERRQICYFNWCSKIWAL